MQNVTLLSFGRQKAIKMLQWNGRVARVIQTLIIDL